jgi:hypothetical protein
MVAAREVGYIADRGKDKYKKHPFLNMFKVLFRLVYPKYVIEGTEKIFRDGPAVFICNHADSSGPISMELFFPRKFRPWVLSDTTSLKDCIDHVEKDFFIHELKMKRPFCRVFAVMIAPLCVMLMRSVGAIPVYRHSARTLITFRLSIESILCGYDIVIFPEDKEKKFSGYINDFYNGFVFISKMLSKKTGMDIKFYPVYIDRNKKVIKIGEPESLNKELNYELEKDKIVNCLRIAINEMAKASAEKV